MLPLAPMMNVAPEKEEDRAGWDLESPSPTDLLGIGRRTEFYVDVCPSPLCHCRDLAFVERTGDGVSAGHRPLRFVLDPFARGPAEPVPQQSSESERLARQVAGVRSTESRSAAWYCEETGLFE